MENVEEVREVAEVRENEEEVVEEESETAEEPEEPEEIEELAVEEEEITEEVEEEVEEEAKPEVVDERIYTIPLGRAWITPRRKRAPRAVRLVKGFVERHMKVGAATEDEEEAGRLVISNEVNEKIWGRGIEKPPRRIRVRAVKDVEGTVTVYLAEGD